MSAADPTPAIPRDRIVAAYASDADQVTVVQRGFNGVHTFPVEYRGYIGTADPDIAADPGVLAVADVEELRGDGLRYVLRPADGRTLSDLRRAISSHPRGTLRDSLRFDAPDLAEAFLLDHDFNLFEGMVYSEIHVAVVTLLIGRTDQNVSRTAFEDHGNVLIGAAIQCGDRKTVVIGDQVTIAERLHELIDEWSPDLLVGFSLASFGMHLLQEIVRRQREGTPSLPVRHGRATVGYPALLDLEALCMQAAARDMQAPLSLTELCDRCGLISPASLSPREVMTLRDSPARVEEHALEELNAAAALVSRYLPGAVDLARYTGTTLEGVCHLHPIVLLERMLHREYRRQCWSLPERSLEQPKRGGGLVENRSKGRFERIVHLDISSAYPTIIASRTLAPRKDCLKALPRIVSRLLNSRAAASQRAKDANAAGDPLEKSRALALETRIKSILVVCYGILGSKKSRWADHWLRAGIAAECQRMARAMADAVTQLGCNVLVIETDGMYVSLPAEDAPDLEKLRASAEHAVNQATEARGLDVRLSGPWDAALITGRLRLISSGMQKGWRRNARSLLVSRVQQSVVNCLLLNDVRSAAKHVTDALRRIATGDVSDEEIAVAFPVCRPPCWTDQDIRSHSTWQAIRESGAVDGEIVWLVGTGSDGSTTSWSVISREAVAQSDRDWAKSELIQALKPLEGLLPVDLILHGGRVRRRVTSVLETIATGAARTELIAGVKSDHAITHREDADFADPDAEDAFVALNPDAHGLLLGYLGRCDGDRSRFSDFLRASVRTGDFAIELEHRTRDDLPLRAVQECIAVLEAYGCDATRDIQVLFNGHRSFLLRIRQSALAVRNCVDLPRLYARFAQALDAEVRGHLDEDCGQLYDDTLYRPSATYRLVGASHHLNGFRATHVSPDALRAAQCLEDLRRTAPQGVRSAAFTGETPVVELRDWFDRVTLDMPRRETCDPTQRVRKETTVARAARDRRHKELRLRVLQDEHGPPCADAVLSRAARGSSIGFAALAKAVFELRLQGWNRREIAERLASGSGGAERYSGRVVQRSDGPDLADSLWPDDPYSSYYRSCTSEEVRHVCSFAICYRSRSVHLFDDDVSPSYENARRLAFEATAGITVPSAPGIAAHEVPPRAGKTTKIAAESSKCAHDGETVLIAAPNHAALDQAATYLKDHSMPGILAVHLLGRGKNRENCVKEHAERPLCLGCENDGSVYASGSWRPNPKLATVARTSEGVVTRAGCHDLANGELCARTVSRHLARNAQIVLATFAHLIHENWPDIAGGNSFDVVFADEADGLVDALASCNEALVLMRSRQSLAGPVMGECDFQCDSCHPDFTTTPSLNEWRGQVQVTAFEACQSPESLLRALQKARAEIGEYPILTDGIDLDAMDENIAALMNALPRHDSVRRGYPVSPREYIEHITSTEESMRLSAQSLAPQDGIPSVFIPLVPCISSHVNRLHDERRWWRRDLNYEGMSPEAEGYLDLADFLDRAATVAGGALLVPRARQGAWQSWLPFCQIELRLMDSAVVKRVLTYLSERRTSLISGTLPDIELLKAIFPGVQIESHSVPMHRDLTFFLHTTSHTGRSDHFLPRRYEPHHLLDLIAEVYRMRRREAPWQKAMNVRIYARSRQEHDKLLRAASEPRPGLHIAGARTPGEYEHTRGATVVVDYLRSPASRAVDVSADLLIVYGSGYPEFTSLVSFREILATLGVHVTVDTLAEDARRRAVVQALLRSAAVKGRRAVLLINDMTAADLPEWLHHRTIAADSLYRDLRPEDAQGDIAAQQRAILAKAIADATVPRSSFPTLEEIKHWSREDATQISARREAANMKRIHAMVARGRDSEALRPSQPTGTKADWCAMLSWLAARGLLKVEQNGNSHLYGFVDGALEYLSSLVAEDPPDCAKLSRP